ncbi:MAG: hypothetical protein J7J31_06610 [Helicobacteraceae bacterium]|nr:hypothetical protein [Helicobacteraceae bacterium]
MASYKKSFLSVAAAIAMSASVAHADYLPLANANIDNEWMLFGASGFLTDGAVAGEAGVFSITTSAANAITDAYTGDELFETSGLTVGAGDLGTLKALNSANTPIEIRVDTTGASFNETEPTRTIYVDTDGDGIGDFAFTYKAQLEGERLEYSVNGGDVYYVTVNYANTYDNPIEGTLILGSDPVAGVNLDDLVDLGDGTLVDYNMTNNPINYLNFVAATHGDAAQANESLRLYSYDAGNGGLWNLFDDRYANSANDFLTLDKGRGYWGKMALDVNRTAGLVLGSSTIAAADYQALNLTEGWNLLAFNKANNSELRHANTGLIFSYNSAAGGGSLTIVDASGNQNVSVTLAGGETHAEAARAINFAIAQAKAHGTIPKTFDLKAFYITDEGAGVPNLLAMISNKKFSVYDDIGGNDVLSFAHTLVGAGTMNPDTGTVNAVAYNVGTKAAQAGVSSIYGEYGLVIEPLPVDPAGANLVNEAKINVKSQLESVAGGTDSTFDILTDLATASTAIDAGVGASGVRGYSMDVDQNGTHDHILMVSSEPFYLRDQTFARVFAYNDSGTAGTITITGAGGQDVASINIGTGSDADTEAQAIDGAAGSIQADDDGSGNIIIRSTDAAGSEFAVYHTGGGDNLAVSSSTSDLAKGSVADVYSLGSLAQKAITNILSLDASAIFALSDVNATLTYTTINDTNLTGTLTATSDIATLQTQIESDLSTLNLGGTVDNNGTHISILSSEIIALYTDVNATGTYEVNATATLGGISSSGLSGDLASDLKYNAVYTPNYVMDGPLYTMRDAGFDLKALVTGTMPMDGVSTMQWDSIDLTRVPSEWFTSQDYNLFKTDEQAGYWAYLEENASPNPLSIGNISLSPLDYVHYYDGATTTNAFSTNIKVSVSGIDETRDPDTLNGGSKSARVTATIGGKKTELTRESQNLYSGKINFYEVEGVNANTAFSIVIDAADGLGNKISTTTSVIDNQKPTAPTASFDGSSITISSTTTDVARYYVFDTAIPEVYSANDELLYLDNEPDGEVIGSGICGADVTISSAAGSLKVVAVDNADGTGTGEIYKGNVSNSTSIPYMAIAKDRIVLSDINNNENDASVGGTPYSTTCTAGTAVTTNDYAMQLTSMTNTKTAKVAFPVMASGVDLTGTPITVYVRNNANDAVAKITYAPAYVGEEVFVMLNGAVYGYTFDDRTTAEATTPTSAIDLSAEVPGGLKSGVTF